MLANIVNLDRYPVDDLDSDAGRTLLKCVHADLAKQGCCVLPGFVREEVMDRMQKEGEAVATDAYYQVETVNAYNIGSSQRLPDDHPARIEFERGNAFVARDLIPEHHLIQQLYSAAAFKQFVAASFGLAEIHELADQLAGLCLNVLQPSKSHPWHFDTNEFTVSILTRLPDEGGQFEYCPDIRSPADENFSVVRKVLLGRGHGRIQKLDLKRGDLQLFKGRYALHRVTEVRGSTDRHTAIFAYTEEPGVIGRLERTMQLFGRTLPQHHGAQGARVRSDSLID